MIRMVVFDMAGTTVDENNVVYKTVREAIAEKGIAVSLEDVLKEGAGKEKLQAIKSVLAKIGRSDDDLANSIFSRFQILLKDAYARFPVKEQSNATRLFHALKERQILVVLNTGYDRATAQSLVDKIGWVAGKDYDALITASDVPKNRPNPDMILMAMDQFDVDNGADVVKVGDSVIDIEEGKNAGCGMTIGITTGAQRYEQLATADPTAIIDDLMEVLPILERQGAEA